MAVKNKISVAEILMVRRMLCERPLLIVHSPHFLEKKRNMAKNLIRKTSSMIVGNRCRQEMGKRCKKWR
jgi:hypothetical protein